MFSKFIKNSSNQLILFKSKSFVGSSSNNISGFPNNACANKTLTFLKELNENEVYNEIMRLSGAVENSKIGLSNAVELKKQSNKYKLK